MSTHAFIQPSALHQLKQCLGSLQLGMHVAPLPDTEVQLEGHAAHWVALQMSEGVMIPAGATAPNGIEVTEDMVDGAYMWFDAIGARQELRCVEQYIPCHNIHMLCEGTPDYADYDPKRRLLRVMDYKFGHRYVDEFENWQLLAYYSGLLGYFNLVDLEIEVEFTIVQPRYYGSKAKVRTWRVFGSELRNVINMISNRAHAAMQPNAPCTSGTECLDCPARHMCSVYQSTTAYIADFTAIADEQLMTPEQVGVELLVLTEASKRLEGRISALQAQAEAFNRDGKRTPNWALEPKGSVYAWKESVDNVILYGEMLQLDLKKPQQVITPTQAEQAAKRAGVDVSLISALAERKSTGMKLARFDATKLRKVFYHGSK